MTRVKKLFPKKSRAFILYNMAKKSDKIRFRENRISVPCSRWLCVLPSWFKYLRYWGRSPRWFSGLTSKSSETHAWLSSNLGAVTRSGIFSHNMREGRKRLIREYTKFDWKYRRGKGTAGPFLARKIKASNPGGSEELKENKKRKTPVLTSSLCDPGWSVFIPERSRVASNKWDDNTHNHMHVVRSACAPKEPNSPQFLSASYFSMLGWVLTLLRLPSHLLITRIDHICLFFSFGPVSSGKGAPENCPEPCKQGAPPANMM